MPVALMVALTITALYFWLGTHPNSTKSLLAEVKRRWRLHLINKYGQLAAADFNRELRRKAAQAGMSSRAVEQVIADTTPELRDELGEAITNERFGEPTPLERYW